jgi:hypothetical protein
MLQSVDVCVKSVVVVVVVVVGSCRYVDLLVLAHMYESMGIHV